MTRLPGAIFIVDIIREKIAVKEAQKLNIPIFAMVDTNSDPRGIDYVIPANDDASKSISKILEHVGGAIQEGLEERNSGKDKEEAAVIETVVETAVEETAAEETAAEETAVEETAAEETAAEETAAEETAAEETTEKKKTKKKTKK